MPLCLPRMPHLLGTQARYPRLPPCGHLLKHMDGNQALARMGTFGALTPVMGLRMPFQALPARLVPQADPKKHPNSSGMSFGESIPE